ncbi:MAG: hypothetical protein AAF677_05140 [Pseudomonadota bacterium]
MFRRPTTTPAWIAALLAAALAAGPAAADPIEDALQAALDAYRAGDVKTAAEEASFATGLLEQQKAQDLSSLLPDPLPGWTAEDGDGSAQGMAAIFGGGLVAQRFYRGPTGTVDLTIMADNPMVASLAPMLSNPAMLAASGGELRRIAGQRVIMTGDGELMAMVNNRFLIQMSGTAAEDALERYFESIDFAALAAF